MNRILSFFTAVILLSAASFASAEEKLHLGGSGGMIPLVTDLAKEFMASHKDKILMVNQQSLQSAGGIKGVADGKLAIGMANRGFKEEEKGLGLQEIEIARVAVVIGANRKINIQGISSEDLCRLYEGKITNWQMLGGINEKVLSLTKSEKDSTKETVRKYIKCFKDLKEADSIVLVPTSPETAKVLTNSKAIGFTDMVTIDDSHGSIVPLVLDGISPTVDNVKSGKYKLVQTFSLVVKGTPAGTVKEFIDFVKSPRGAKIIEANKAIPIK